MGVQARGEQQERRAVERVARLGRRHALLARVQAAQPRQVGAQAQVQLAAAKEPQRKRAELGLGLRGGHLGDRGEPGLGVGGERVGLQRALEEELSARLHALLQVEGAEARVDGGNLRRLPRLRRRAQGAVRIVELLEGGGGDYE